jgi:hypothetical protein
MVVAGEAPAAVWRPLALWLKAQTPRRRGGKRRRA